MSFAFNLTRREMDVKLYKAIISQIESYRGLTKDCTIDLHERYPNVPRDTIASIVSQECQKRVKQSNYKDTAALASLYSTFKKLKQEDRATGFLLDVAIEFGLAPTIIARRALKQYFIELVNEDRYGELFPELIDSESELSNGESELSASQIELSTGKVGQSGHDEDVADLSDIECDDGETELLDLDTDLWAAELNVSVEDPEWQPDVDPNETQDSESTEEECEAIQLPLKAMIRLCIQDHTFINDPDLAYEVFQCTLFDDQYSPFAEAVKLNLGQQYELQLQRHLHSRGILFQDEQYLRKHGFDKTPDVKLDVAISLNGVLVNWIESKAMFGNEDTHRAYVEEQYRCYWNRFGPGLVVYWFGYVDTILDPGNAKLLILDHLPEQLVVAREPTPST